MLVLSRKPGEAIWIGSEVTITVLDVQGKRVRLGVSAPANVKVVRGELNELPDDADEPAQRSPQLCAYPCEIEVDLAC